MRIVLFTLFIWASLGYSQNSWDLKSCIDYAVKHNIQIKQSDINRQMNKNNFDQSKANVLPTLNLGAAHAYNYGKTIDRFTNTFANTQVLSQNFFISSNVVLFSGLSQYNTIKANEYNYLSSSELIKQQQNDLALNVANAYLNVIFTEELNGIAKNQVNMSLDQLNRTKKMVEAGSLAKSVQLDLEAQLANEEVNLTNAENNYKIALLNLIQLLNLENPSNSFTVVKPAIDLEGENLLNNNVDQIYEAALKMLPDVKASEYGMKSSEKNLAAAKGRMAPTLSLNGAMGTGTSGLAKDIKGVNLTGFDTTAITTGGDFVLSPTYQLLTETKPFADQFKDNVNKSVGLTISIPLFNGLQTHTAVKNAKLNVLNAKLNLDLTKQNLYKSVVQAYTGAQAALARYMANKKSVEASAESFRYAEQKFNAGAMNALDYNLAKNRLLNAESNLIQSKYEYVLRIKILDFYQGKDWQF